MTTTRTRNSPGGRLIRRPQPAAIPDKVFFRIGEVAKLLGVRTSVLRFWETEFPTAVPAKSRANQRVYRRSEVETLFKIRQLLYVEKYSISGARRRLRGARTRQESESRLRELAGEIERLARQPITRLFKL